MKKVKDVMTREVKFVGPETLVLEAARRMRDLDIGAFPVCDGGRVIGIVTDRDLTVRVLAEARDPVLTRVADVMTREVICASPEEDLAFVEMRMRERQVRRVPVVSKGDTLVGLVSIGRIAKVEDEQTAGKVLKSVTLPGPPPSVSVA